MCMHAKSLQLCPTLCDPMDTCVHSKSLQSYLTPSDAMDHSLQARLSVGFSGLPCPPPRNFPTEGLNPCLLHLLRCQAGSLTLAPPCVYVSLYFVYERDHILYGLQFDNFLLISVLFFSPKCSI